MALLGVKPPPRTSSKASDILGMSSMLPSTVDVPYSDLGGGGAGGRGSRRTLLSRNGSMLSANSTGSGSRGNGSYHSSAGVIPNLQPQHHPNYKANLQQERGNVNGNGNNGSASAASSSNGRSVTSTDAGGDSGSCLVRTLMDEATSRIIVSNGGGVLVIADRKLRDMQSHLEEITRGGGSSSKDGGGGDGANHSKSQDQDKSSSEEIIELVSTLQEKNDRSDNAIQRLMSQIETLRSERDAAIEKSERLKREMESRDEREMEEEREVERRRQKRRESLNAFIAKASHGEPSQEQWQELVKLATKESPARRGGSSAKSVKSDKRVRFAEAETDNHRRYTQTLHAVLNGRKEDAGSRGARASRLRALLGLVLVFMSATFLWRYRAGQRDAISAFPNSHPPAHATDFTPEASSSTGGEGMVEAAVDSSSAPQEDGEASSIGGEKMKESAVGSLCAPGEVGAIECG